jgi:hypothetical protein
MKPEKELIQDGLTAQEAPTAYTNINTITIEAEAPCRAQSALQFLDPYAGIFLGVKKEKITVNIRGIITEVIVFNLALNPTHRIKPGADVPNCTRDGATFLPAQSVNVSAVAEPQYLRNSENKVTNVVLYFTRANRTQPATLGIRVKFEENVSLPAQFNPKRKSGTVSFP